MGTDGRLALSTSEQTILGTLANRLNMPVPRHELAEATGTSQERSVDVAITRLRKKLGEDPRDPQWLQTVRGAGYRLLGQFEDG
jgi:two-component system phosphate regulon response regulator OmpR